MNTFITRGSFITLSTSRALLVALALGMFSACASQDTQEEHPDENEQHQQADGHTFGAGIENVKRERWRGYEQKAPSVSKYELADQDQDGIIDSRDDCGGTNIGIQVDNKGCAKTFSEISQQSLQINFGTNQAVVEPKYYPTIERVAKEYHSVAESGEPSLILVEGHTDNVGSREYNQALSLKRARSVANLLVDKFGVDKQHLFISGRGFDYPVASNTTAEGRAKNRRMVAYFAHQDRFEKVQWNIWSVELKEDEQDQEDRRRFQGLTTEESL